MTIDSGFPIEHGAFPQLCSITPGSQWCKTSTNPETNPPNPGNPAPVSQLRQAREPGTVLLRDQNSNKERGA